MLNTSNLLAPPTNQKALNYFGRTQVFNLIVVSLPRGRLGPVVFSEYTWVSHGR